MNILIFLMILAVVSGVRIIRPTSVVLLPLIDTTDNFTDCVGDQNYCNYTDSCHHFDEPCFFIQSIKTTYLFI